MTKENQPQVQDFVSQDYIDRAGNFATNCRRMDHPKDAELVGEGASRCVFRSTKDEDVIIKVGRHSSGRTQNNQARLVKNEVKNTQDYFAMPLDISENNGVMIQEYAQPYLQTVEEEKQEKIIEESLDKQHPTQQKIEDKMHETTKKDGIKCIDSDNPANWGYKDNNLILLDVGGCTTTD